METTPYPWHHLEKVPLAATGWTERAHRLWSTIDLHSVVTETSRRVGTPVRLGAARWSYPTAREDSLLDARAYAFDLVHPAQGISIAVVISARMGAALAARLLGSDESVVEPLSAPAEFDCALVVHLAGELLAALHIQGWHVSSRYRQHDMPGPAVSLDLWLGDDVPGCVWVYWPTKTLAALAMPPKSEIATPAADLPITAVLDIKSVRIPLADLKTWSIGCVLVPDGMPLVRDKSLSGNGTFRALGTACAWACDFSGEEICVTTEQTNPSTAAGEVVANASEATRTKVNWEQLSDAPIELQIELARFTFPLGRIAELTAGTIIRAHQPIGSTVRLRAQDKVIAVGELVDVEGEIGIRLTEVL